MWYWNKTWFWSSGSVLFVEGFAISDLIVAFDIPCLSRYLNLPCQYHYDICYIRCMFNWKIHFRKLENLSWLLYAMICFGLAVLISKVSYECRTRMVCIDSREVCLFFSSNWSNSAHATFYRFSSATFYSIIKIRPFLLRKRQASLIFNEW